MESDLDLHCFPIFFILTTAIWENPSISMLKKTAYEILGYGQGNLAQGLVNTSKTPIYISVDKPSKYTTI